MSTDVVGGWLPTLSRILNALIICIGGLTLLGYALRIADFERPVSSPVAMNPVTALLLIISGLALWFRRDAPQSSSLLLSLSYAFALLTTVVGACKSVDYVIGLPFHIDRFLFPSTLPHLAQWRASEMSPNTALSFLFIGLALLLFNAENRNGFRPAQALSLVAGFVALLALIGYLYRVLVLNRLGPLKPMPLESAIAFALFFLSFLAAQPDRGFMLAITSRTTGGSMARRLLPMAILIPLLLGFLLLAGEQVGLFRQEFAVGLFAVANILIFTGLIWWNARLLYRSDLRRTRAEEQLRQTTANLQRSNTELQQFAHVASHDLFEPLRMVTSYLQLLQQNYQAKLDQRANEFVNFALDGAKRMDALIHDLLAYSRVEVRGRPFEPTNTEHALVAALSNLKVAIEETGATISHGSLPRVFADSVQLTQVFQNLIGNAIKFHGTKSPRIEVTAHRRENEWLFLVRDNGIGIDPKFFDTIFVIFQRLHTRREYAGTGMGLAICKKIIERHGGRIWVESVPGKGSTFFFTLPATEETQVQC